MTVLHAETARDSAELSKAESFVKMSGMDVAFYNGIELKYSESMKRSLFYAVGYQLFAYMLTAAVRAYRIACI